MATVHFKPYSAVKYVGSKSKEHLTSLARPKPVLKKGDILIVDKRQAANMTTKGFGEFIAVDDISFVKADVATAQDLKEHKDEVERLTEYTQVLEEQIETAKQMQKADIARIEELEAKNSDLETKLKYSFKSTAELHDQNKTQEEK